MSAATLIPAQGGTPQELLEKLGANFSLDPIVVEGLIKAKIQNLEEFRFFFDSDAKVETWLNKISLGEDKAIQVARLRRAWHAVGLYFSNFEQDRSKVQTSDLDSLLDDAELRTAKQAFWIRYKVRYPTELYFGDSTVSRVTRELTKRMLCVTSVWKVKSLQWQLTTTSKKRKLGEGLYTEEPDEEEPCPRDYESYPDRLMTLMLAYALGGVTPIAGAPAAKDEEQLGADTTKFVHVPLDVVLKYHARAKRSCYQLSAGRRLAWLQSRDLEERAEWVSLFRESTKSLGEIIVEVYNRRDAHWAAPPGNEPMTPPAKTPPAAAASTPPPLSKFVIGGEIHGKQFARVMRDGVQLCQAFQRGECKAKGACKGGAHRCGIVLKKQRVCGSSSHGASQCKTNVKKA